MKLRLSDVHRLRHRGRDYLMVVKNAALAEVDAALGEALSALETAGGWSEAGLPEEEIRRAVEERCGAEGAEVLEDMAGLQLFEPADGSRAHAFLAVNRGLGQDAARP